MSVEVKTNIEDPLGWVHEEYGVWRLISDYTDSERYRYLDSIYHYLTGGMRYDDGVIGGKTKEELKEEYDAKFPLLLAEAFENTAKDMTDGHLVIKTMF